MKSVATETEFCDTPLMTPMFQDTVSTARKVKSTSSEEKENVY